MSIANLLTDGNKELTDLKVRSIVLTEGTFQVPLDFYGISDQLITFDGSTSVYLAPINLLIRLARIGKIVTITVPAISGISKAVPTGSFSSTILLLDGFRPTVDVFFTVIGIAIGVSDDTLPYKVRIETSGVITITFQLGSGVFGNGQTVGVQDWATSYLV